MKTLILGGIKSGKSKLAEVLATESQKNVTLIATADAKDVEMQTRIEHHKRSRPPHWLVIEEPLALADALIQPLENKDYIIIDCLTLWLTNLLLDEDKTTLAKETTALLDILSASSGTVTMISNETSMGISSPWVNSPGASVTRQACCTKSLLPIATMSF